jgi:hypothetical protein
VSSVTTGGSSGGVKSAVASVLDEAVQAERQTSSEILTSVRDGMGAD